MLERLARWLRATGADVASAPGTAPDAAVRRLATTEGRVLLTRDRAFDRPAPAGHAACSPGAPHHHLHTPEDGMSGSTGNTSTGTKGGRPAQNANHDLTARHGDDLAHGVRHSDDTGASTSARVTESGESDTRRQDPDDPANTHANQSEE